VRITRRPRIIAFTILVGFIWLFLIREHVLRQIGQFLVLEQSPQKADAIVILNGRDTERSLAAVDLFKGGYSRFIVMAAASKQAGSDEFWNRVGRNFRTKPFFQRAIEAMGIPEESYKLIGDGVTSTYDEALVTRKFVLERGYRSILLVTSKWHSKRAYLTFRSAFRKEGIKIIVYPSKYDSFNPEKWWTRESDIEMILYEYIRLVYYVLTSRITIIR
jgi:uncharacterized SAM-binding protein YcdF (DUF218 family)